MSHLFIIFFIMIIEIQSNMEPEELKLPISSLKSKKIIKGSFYFSFAFFIKIIYFEFFQKTKIFQIKLI